MKQRRRRPTVQPMASINMTSLLDIVFVLLIAFMVVAPALKHGIEIELPRVREVPVAKESRPISVTVRGNGGGEAEVFVDGQAVQLALLVASIEERRGGDDSRPVALEGDRFASWEQMAAVVAELQRGGVGTVGIMTTPKGSPG
jgi:biopolymer transport protein ExbD